jgi:FKBP-type peptidyl-prolyl cis-trans isomerase 2
MKIVKNSVVTVRYTLTDAEDNLIEEGQEPMVYLHGGYDNIFPKIEEALDGKEAGFETRVQLEPEDAFGDYDAQLLKIEARDRFLKVWKSVCSLKAHRKMKQKAKLIFSPLQISKKVKSCWMAIIRWQVWHCALR